MKKTAKISILLLALLAVGAATNVVNQFELPTAKVTVRVVDENQQPVENANVSLGFGETSSEGTTDVNGLFTGEGRCNISGIGSMIKKTGYYMGYAPTPNFREYDKALNRWKPWDETCTVILRPVGKPMTFYGKKVQADVPVLGQPCGYDLETGDWVTPYGKGLKTDFIFNIQKKYVKDARNFDSQGELTFPNSSDGLQETSIPDIGTNSMFKWERRAPESGYQQMFKLQNTWLQSSGKKAVRSFKFDDKEWEGYFFRVRTVEQNGQIISAHYGKIRGGIEIEPRESKTCTIIFTYYLNPTPNDHNMEFDPKQNLIKNLSWETQVREP